jgi:hypothetical protein
MDETCRVTGGDIGRLSGKDGATKDTVRNEPRESEWNAQEGATEGRRAGIQARGTITQRVVSGRRDSVSIEGWNRATCQ